MNKAYVSGLLFTLLLAPALQPVRAEVSPHVHFSEIAWAGSARNASDEWLELTNPNAYDVDISGWTIQGGGTSHSDIVLGEAIFIPAYSTFLVANYANGSSNSTLNTTPNIVTTTLSLPNSGISLALLNQGGEVVDTFIDSGTPNAGSSTTYASAEYDGVTGAWLTAETSTNLLDGQLGSPGIAGHLLALASSTTDPESTETQDILAINEETSNPGAPPGIDTNETLATDEALIENLVEGPSPVEIDDTDAQTEDGVASEDGDSPEEPVLEEITAALPALKITGFLSAPLIGEDEWVELTNFDAIAIDLALYVLQDASGKQTVLQGVLEPSKTFIVLNPNGNLNNDGDTIGILTVDGVPIDSVAYGTDELSAPKSNTSLRLVDEIWESSMALESNESLQAETAAEPSLIITEAPEDSLTPSEGVGIGTAPEETINATELQIEVMQDSPIVEQVAIEQIGDTTSDSGNAVETVEEPLGNAKNEPDSITVNEDVDNYALSILPGDLIIDSALPAPNAGDDEWVMLTNTTQTNIDLQNLVLVDASGAVTALTGTIAPQASVYVLNPKGNLNNDKETLTLQTTEGTAIDNVAYGTELLSAPKKGAIISFDVLHAKPILQATISPTLYENSNIDTAGATAADGSDATLATPAKSSSKTSTSAVATVVTSAPTTHSATSVKTATKKAKTTSSAKKSSASTSVATLQSVKDIDHLAHGTAVQITGIVVAKTNVLGKRSFYLDGLEIYQNQGDVADVHEGDEVKILGSVSVLSDRRRVNVKEGGVTVMSSGHTPIPSSYSATARQGSFITITGTVSARDGSAILLKSDSGQTFAVAPGASTDITWADYAGRSITVTGILKSQGEQPSIVIRSASDVMVVAPSEVEPPKVTATASKFGNNLVLPGALGLLFALLGAWFWYTRPKATLKTLKLHSSSL